MLTNSNNDNDSNGNDCASTEDSSSKHNNGDDSNVEIADSLHIAHVKILGNYHDNVAKIL